MSGSISPIYKKEIIMEVRGKKLPLIILIYNALLAITGMFIFTTSAGKEILQNITDYADMINIYSALLLIEYVIVLLIVPVYAASRVSSEYEHNSMQLLLLTKMSHFQIVWAKICSVVTVMMILVLSSLPVFLLIFSTKGISVLLFIKYLFIVITTTMFVGSIGVLFSTIFKRTIPAVIFTYILLASLTIGTFYSMKGIPVVMLVNPVFSMLKLLVDNSESAAYLNKMVNGIGNSGFLVENWMFISVIVQAVISTIIIYTTTTLSKVSQYGKKLKSLPTE